MPTVAGREFSVDGAHCPPALGGEEWDYPDREGELGLRVRVRPPGKLRARLSPRAGGQHCLRVDFQTAPATGFSEPPRFLELTVSYGAALKGPSQQTDVRFEPVEHDALYSVHVNVNVEAATPKVPRVLVSARLPPYNGHVVLPVR